VRKRGTGKPGVRAANPRAANPRAAKPRAAAARRDVVLPRIAKGRRPEFYEDPAIDQLFAIVTALTGEISVLFDRLDTLERLLDAAGTVPAQAIEAYVPEEAAATLRAERRDELLRRVFAVLELYAAPKAASAS
jgi:hypothetical protein